MHAASDESRWLALAQSISGGHPIDWEDAERQASDEEELQVLRALRTLEEIARVHSTATPNLDERPSKLQDPEAAIREPERQRWQHLTLLQPIGQGAFGTVYRARDEQLDSEVALKLLWPRLGGGATPAHFLKEARLLARVRHQNVVTVYGAEHADGRIGIWMEYIKGRTLSEILSSHGPFGAREAAAIGVDLCSALAAVHGVGLLHRDVKARNVMREEGGRIVLMDFGAGIDTMAAGPHGVRDLAGTPLYLAPELFEGHRATAASDIYSLGVLLYHLVSGTYPLDGADYDELAQAHRARRRKLLFDSRPDLPESFIRVVERALAHEPGERYASAGAFADALAASLGLQAPAYTQISRDRSVSPGRPRFAPGTVVGLAAALVIVAGAGLLWWRGGSGPAAPTDAPPVSAAVPRPAAPAEAAPAPVPSSYQISAAFHTVNNGRDTVLRPGAMLAPSDTLYLTVQASTPAYVYVVNQDEQGESFLLFPLPGQSVTNPLPPRTVNRLPGDVGGQELYWQVTSAGGREHFFVLAAPERLEAIETMVSALPRPRLGEPVIAAPLTREVVGVLRSVGGLVRATPPATAVPQAFPFATPLLDTPETVQGLWAREITFANPAR
jgi:serine/threonine-protein kinase